MVDENVLVLPITAIVYSRLFGYCGRARCFGVCRDVNRRCKHCL